MAHEHDHECGCGHHHHDEDTEHLHTDKYQQAFAKFEPAGSPEEVAERVKTLLEKHGKENFTPDVLKQIHGFIDLTSLTSIDTKESIWKLVDKVNDFEGTRPDVPNVAAICTYPLFVETVKQALAAQAPCRERSTQGFLCEIQCICECIPAFYNCLCGGVSD